MAKIKHSDLFAGNIFKKTIDSAKAALQVLGSIEKQVKSILVASTNLAKQTPLKGYKNIKQVEASLKNVASAEANLTKIEAAKIKVQRELERLQAQRVKQQEQLASRQKKINTELQKEQGLLGQLKKRIAELKQQQLFAKTPAELAKVNAQLKTTQREFRRLSQVGTQSTNTFANAIRSFGFKFNFLSDIVSQGVFAISNFVRQGIGGSINLIRDFEKANAELAGVLNTTRDGVSRLTRESERLGSITVKTSSEVTQLQIAYARLGFSQQEIIDLTESTINGSIALNAELDQTAELTGAVVKTFSQFSTTDAPEILDKMVASTQASALSFEKLQTALPVVGGAAEAAGINFDQLLSLLGKLSDAGIDASSSATSLRNIFIESAKQGLNYNQILNKIVSSQDQLTAANDEFGKRAAVSGTILANNIEATAELESVISEAGGTAERVAKEQLDTLDGAIKSLRSAWEGFILSLNRGDAISGRLASVIRFLAENLRTIIKVLGILVGSWIAYRAAIAGANLATKAYAIATRTANAVQLLFTRGTKAATVAVRTFNNTTKTTVLGALVSALTAAVSAFFLFSDAADNAKESQDGFNESVADGAKILEELEDIYKKQGNQLVKTGDFFDNLNKKVKDLNKVGLEALAQTLRDEVAKATREVENETVELLKTVSQDNLQKYSKALEIVTAELEKFNKKTKETKESTEEKETAIKKLRRRIKELNEELLNQAVIGKINNDTFREYFRLTNELKDAEEELQNKVEDASSSIDTLSVKVARASKEIKANLPTVEPLVSEEDVVLTTQRLEVIQAAIVRINESIERASERRIRQLERELEATVERQRQLAEKANQGVLEAQESLAAEQAKQRRLELARQREEVRQQKIKAGFDILSALLAAGRQPGQAITETGALLAALPPIIDAIPTFIEGTGDGTIEDALGKPHLQGQDGYIIRADGKEKIFNPTESALIPQGMSNFEVATLAAEYGRKKDISDSNISLLNEVKKLNQTIKNKPEYLGSDIDTVHKLIRQTVKKGKNIEKNHKRYDNLW